MTKNRLDFLVIERGLCATRAQAQRAIIAGHVLVNGQISDKPGAQVFNDALIELKEQARYVSQGGLKLEKALRAFQIDVHNRVCLDVGASTGGFTDCLLQHGASKAYCADVGKGQLDWKLRNDPRVVVLEEINARYLKPEQIGETIDLATIDVSFISLKLILPPLRSIVKSGGDLVCLVKPQFEAGREKVKRGGVVKDPEVHRHVLEELTRFSTEDLALSVVNATYSPIKGPAGNIEFFLYIKNGPGVEVALDFARLVEEAQRQHRFP